MYQNISRMVYLDRHGTTMRLHNKEIPSGGSTYVYLVGDINFLSVPEYKQLLVVPLIRRTLRMHGIGECIVGSVLPDEDRVEEIHRRFAGFREGNGVESCLTYTTTKYFSVYGLVQKSLRSSESTLSSVEKMPLALLLEPCLCRVVLGIHLTPTQ